MWTVAGVIINRWLDHLEEDNGYTVDSPSFCQHPVSGHSLLYLPDPDNYILDKQGTWFLTPSKAHAMIPILQRMHPLRIYG